jgi:predicted nucleic acid-binding protein
MILLDTNIVSEGLTRRPNAVVKAWIDAQSMNELYLCTPVLAELHFGAELLAEGARKRDLRAAIDRIEDSLFRGRILALDVAAAKEYAHLMAGCRKVGRPIDLMDALIASIARSQCAILATRNVGHFADLGLEVINPFEPSA